jgi:hypothetical protein
MQKLITSDARLIKGTFYVTAIVFHVIVLFTNAGNYIHGGTLAELLILQAVAVLIVAVAMKLLAKSRTIEKFFIVLCATVPTLSIIGALVSAILR